ncbi:ATP-binding protein [Gilvimarinus sp. SDUM040013]|uniref:histidine kinase n=1 Tax=Gilvimarinus gilvus TaxID=3058038 RepID=A0ABU4RT46_9GAMM|nr:ATP-binding protein [Gilvimarinus sp. SDUM040013]MDO3387052.1 ATP-binding protein [Gilvimarinus sp. SDUM040013]MDX6848054.1 ATP-binding protein [Gilvimarinus sp. SDUM040013]
MKLRQQLALLALVGLLIPGITLYSLQIFNEQAKASHINALVGMAEAIAARLASDDELLQASGLAGSPQIPADQELYSHRLFGDGSEAGITIDGATGDWQALALEPLPLAGSDAFSASYRAVTDNLKTYFLIEVEDTKRHYHQAGSERLATGDHLLLFAGNQQQGLHYFVVRAELPGAIEAVYRNAFGQSVRQERIRGVWQETEQGYRVELSLPSNMTQGPFALAAVDQAPFKALRVAGTLATAALATAGPDPGVIPPATGRLVSNAAQLHRALQVFNRPATRLTLLDPNRWQRAQTGQLTPDNPAAKPLQKLLHWVTKRPQAGWQDVHSGLWSTPPEDASEAPHFNGWTHDHNTLIARVEVPVHRATAAALEARYVGSIVIEQAIMPWQLLDHSATRRLLLSSLLGGGALLLLLIGYASWLSARITKLSRAAGNAAKPGQSLNRALEQWPRLTLNDEIGQLSRHYRGVLSQLQDHNEYLRSLTGKLSHELRTPLAVVTGSLDNLMAAEPGAIGKYAQRAREGSLRLSRIVSAMTEASRVEASISSAELENVDLKQLLSDIHQAYQSAYPQQKFELSIQTAAPETYCVQVAPELLVQMLDKLVDNAVSFALAETPVQLELTYRADDSRGVLIELAVSNQGPPLPSAMQGRLFHSLTSERRTGDSSAVHLGLGLYIVELIARFHQGEAAARNIDNGVCFSVSMPAKYPALSARRAVTSVDNSP